jgi:hypothetical protein
MTETGIHLLEATSRKSTWSQPNARFLDATEGDLWILHLECAVTVSLAVVIQAGLPIALQSSPAPRDEKYRGPFHRRHKQRRTPAGRAGQCLWDLVSEIPPTLDEASYPPEPASLPSGTPVPSGDCELPEVVMMYP